jgi:cation:H+ antiporter
MIAVAAAVGISEFFLVQWVAPFLSEFPEFVSTFSWARRVTKAPMALMNIVSSNINQWTILAAMIPIVYGFSHLRHYGVWADFTFDIAQRNELALTLLQSLLGVLLLANMEFDWMDATALFVLWAVQFTVPDLRGPIMVAYGVWAVVLVIGFVVKGQPLRAPACFWQIVRQKRSAGTT